MNDPRDNKAVRDAIMLAAVGIVLAQLGVVLCGLINSNRSVAAHPRWEILLSILVTLSLGAAFVGLVLLLRHYIRLLDTGSRSDSEIRDAPTLSAVLPLGRENEPRSEASAQLNETLKEVLRLLQEMRDLSILPEDERRKRAEE